MVGFNFGTLAKLYVGNRVTALLQLDLSTLLSGITSSQVARGPHRLYEPRQQRRLGELVWQRP
jgi:hypothetical protein